MKAFIVVRLSIESRDQKCNIWPIIWKILAETLVTSHKINIFRANEELDTIEAKKDLELTRAYAEIRLLKTKNESLENQLNLKKDENEELIKICDQLMGSK